MGILIGMGARAKKAMEEYNQKQRAKNEQKKVGK